MPQALTPLSDLAPGATGFIRQLLDDTEQRAGFNMAERLRELGFFEETPFEVLHQAPLGRDPMAVKIGDMIVALRRRDARGVLVELNI